jgi:hypothetical protein
MAKNCATQQLNQGANQ